ncbi:restriction endonuclease subunit S [Lysobacter yangpyeongensis]|uniref:Restriction endonuclease subunit S n=1 Tax=Lysobacter yangpyeongensis TaxID=346182 RepID=A0ABW0SQ48_9GAMM
MASEWRPVRIEEIAEKIAMGPFGSNIKVETFVDEGIPVISGAHLHGTRVEDGDFNFVTPEHAEKLRNSNVYRGDVIFTHAGNIGQVAYVPNNSRYERYVISQRQFYLRCDQAKADPAFITYFFHSPEGRHKLLANASQVGVPSISRPSSNLKEIEVALPSLAEQRAIVDLLGLIEDRIGNLRQTNATLEAIAQALFKSWFVDFDPVLAKAEGREPEGMDAATAALFPSEFEDSELGPIPRAWGWATLGVLCESRGGFIQTGPFGSQLHASDYVEVGVPVVMPQDLSGRRVIEDRIARIAAEDADRLERHKLRAGDIVFSRRGDVGRHAAISEREAGWLCGTGCLLVRPGSSESVSAFFSAALARPEATEWLVRHAVGATMPNLNTRILSNLPMIQSPPEIMSAFESICGPLESRVSANLEQAAQLSALRDALLPRLISGKLRLPEAATVLEELTESNGFAEPAGVA